MEFKSKLFAFFCAYWLQKVWHSCAPKKDKKERTRTKEGEKEIRIKFNFSFDQFNFYLWSLMRNWVREKSHECKHQRNVYYYSISWPICATLITNTHTYCMGLIQWIGWSWWWNDWICVVCRTLTHTCFTSIVYCQVFGCACGIPYRSL